MAKNSRLRQAVTVASRLVDYSRNQDHIKGTEITFAAFILNAVAASGSYRGVFILDRYVIKFPRYAYRVQEMVNEANFINRLRKTKYARHFPRTRYLSNGVMLQEKCDVNDELFDENYDQLTVLARMLRVGDLHRGNVGWRYEKNGPVPVFIDVEFRDGDFAPVDPKQRRSWHVV